MKCFKMMTLAGVTLLFGTVGVLAQSDLIVEKRMYNNGNQEIEIVNRSDGGIDIYSVVVNRSNSPECRLGPIRSSFGDSFLRGDLFTNPELTRFEDQQPIDAVSLPFGGTVTAVSPRTCGRVLEVTIETENTEYVYTWDN